MNKPYIVRHVTSAAMHVIYESHLNGSKLWPKNGFKAGHGVGNTLPDCIYVGVNPFGIDNSPISGRLYFNVFNTKEIRQKKQSTQIKLIMDYALYDNVYFEDELRDSSLISRLWFNFTVNPQNNSSQT